MNRVLLSVFYLAVLPLFAAEPAPLPKVTKENVFQFYQELPKLSKRPYDVPLRIAMLCAGGPMRDTAEEDKRAYGPHYNARVQIYANQAGQAAANRSFAFAARISSKRGSEPFNGFPVGAMIVKEKLAPDNSVTGIGGMIKHAAGYDPESGDWEYFYADKAGQFLSGRLTQCADCHLKAKKSDFVFGRWMGAE